MAAPKLSKYMTALGAYNVKSFTYEINQHTHEHTHIHTHTHTHTHTHHTTPHTHTHTHHTHTHTHARALTQLRTHTQALSKKFVLRKVRLSVCLSSFTL